jgi:hypothetical protein
MRDNMPQSDSKFIENFSAVWKRTLKLSRKQASRVIIGGLCRKACNIS